MIKSKTVWLLAASLMANVFLVGFTVGRVAPPPFPMGPRPDLMDRRPHDMPRGADEKVQKIIEELHSRRHLSFEKMEAARADVIAILEAPTFDEALFLQKSQEMEGIASAEKQEMLQKIASLAKTLTQTERRALAANLRHPPRPQDRAFPHGPAQRSPLDSPPPPVE